MKECIILAGGFGTRLQSVVNDVPKCMAEVAGKPFLEHLFNYLEEQRFNHIILSLGYKGEVVIKWLNSQKRSFEVSYVIEDIPLGTGGAIKLAMDEVDGNTSFVMNGDTFFNVDTERLIDFHKEKDADISIALKNMKSFDRYGVVELTSEDKIISFNEKQFREEGLINGGVYLVNKQIFFDRMFPNRFSFEKDLMEAYIDELAIYGLIEDNYFIDIGIPSDYEKANEDFKKGIISK